MYSEAYITTESESKYILVLSARARALWYLNVLFLYYKLYIHTWTGRTVNRTHCVTVNWFDRNARASACVCVWSLVNKYLAQTLAAILKKSNTKTNQIKLIALECVESPLCVSAHNTGHPIRRGHAKSWHSKWLEVRDVCVQLMDELFFCHHHHLFSFFICFQYTQWLMLALLKSLSSSAGSYLVSIKEEVRKTNLKHTRFVCQSFYAK